MNRKKNKSTNINDLARTIRRNWNGINPVTRIVESKKNKPIKGSWGMSWLSPILCDKLKEVYDMSNDEEIKNKIEEILG